MDPQVFYEVLVPLMEVDKTATIGISTPLGKFNFYTELTDAMDENGRRIFNVLEINGDDPPPWKTQSSRGRVKALYGARETLYRREILGEVADDAENAAFNQQHLERLFGHPAMPTPYPITGDYVYVAMDPNGGASASGGPGSETAIVSFLFSQGRMIITGIESHPTPGPEQARQILYAHIGALQKQACFDKCRFMLIPEANLGSEAQLCAQFMLRRNPRVDVLCEFSHAYGVWTKPGDPERYVLALRERLAADGIFLHNKMVCVGRFKQQLSAEATFQQIFKEFKRQLFSFRAVHIVPQSLTGRVRLVYSGKADKDGKRSSRVKDDMCMALLFGLFYAVRFQANSKMVGVRNTHNMLELDPHLGTANEGAPDELFAPATSLSAVAKRKRVGK